MKSTTFAPTRTRQASPRCSNVRVVFFDEKTNVYTNEIQGDRRYFLGQADVEVRTGSCGQCMQQNHVYLGR